MRRILFILLLTPISLNLICQGNWIKHPANPVLEPGEEGAWDQVFISPGSILYIDSIYHMWYSGGIFTGTLRIGHATSEDGIAWSKDQNNPVLDVGSEGEWDENSIIGGYVVIVDTIFHMWYTGHSGSDFGSNYRIGHATSVDGVTWEKDATNPVLDLGPDGSWDDVFIAGGHVFHDGTRFHIYYSGFNGGPENVRCGHATSPNGIAWTKDDQNPVLSYETGSWDYPRVDLPSVIFDGKAYHMWYNGGHHFSDWHIGYAKSLDGSQWTKHSANPVLNGTPDSWDAASVGFCSVIDSAGVKYKMWYSGCNSGQNGCIGYAEMDASSLGIDDHRHDGISVYPNPVKEHLILHSDLVDRFHYEITSVNGQKVCNGYVQGNIQRIDLSSIPDGVYFITIKSEESIKIEKIIKQ